MPNLSFLGSLLTTTLGVRGGEVGEVSDIKSDIMLISVQIGLNWKWLTGTELDNSKKEHVVDFVD